MRKLKRLAKAGLILVAAAVIGVLAVETWMVADDIAYQQTEE